MLPFFKPSKVSFFILASYDTRGNSFTIFESVDKVFTSDISSKFKERGAIIAGNFVRKLNL